jgi:hypothetical protein
MGLCLVAPHAACMAALTIVQAAVARGPWGGRPAAHILGVLVAQVDAIPRGTLAQLGVDAIPHKVGASTGLAYTQAALGARAVVGVAGGIHCGAGGAADDAPAGLGAPAW